ncbi:MAG: hypothetical protein Ta2B_03070 [Termitinemataceae bacterium]|nr:MAG: hypothetical protein Ta2B_03070 [Termitinemataceae bacterium]
MINKKTEGTKVTLRISGKMDASSSPELEAEIKALSPIVKELIFDLADIEYISSIGLRNVLLAYKLIRSRGGRFNICNIPEQVRDIFEMSGFMNTFQRDEKLVVLQKNVDNDSAVIALLGVLNDETSATLETQLFSFKTKNLKSIALDCEKLESISGKGCNSLKNIQTVLGSNIVLLNTNKDVACEIIKSGLDSLLPACENPEIATDRPDTICYKLKKEWEISALPYFREKWYETNKIVQNIIVDFSQISDISNEAFEKLKELRKIAEAHNVKIDVKM